MVSGHSKFYAVDTLLTPEVQCHSRVVDEDVQLVLCLDDIGSEIPNGLLAAKVELLQDHVAIARCLNNLLMRLLGRVQVPAGHDDTRALAGNCASRHFANAAVGPYRER